MSHRALHQVRPLIGRLHRYITRAHDVGVVASPPAQHVRNTADVREDVIQAVPGPVDGQPREGEIFDIGAQGVVHTALHRIDAVVRLLRHDIPGIVHHIDIVARAAEHRIGPRGPAEHVRRTVAREDVI